jgi:hypothetical protein
VKGKTQTFMNSEAKEPKKQTGSMTAPAMIVCIAAGIAVGAAHESIILGTAIGAGIGIAIGAGFEQKRKQKD